ncbi:MAG: polysaccharide deacetylase family protein [Fibrobacteria bacterium]
MSATPLPAIRFLGDRSKPDYPAVAHLLRNYAAHLGAGLIEVADSEATITEAAVAQDRFTHAAADVYWGCAPVNPENPCLVFPARASAAAALTCSRTRAGYPVPPAGLAFPGSTGGSALPGGPALTSNADILDAAGDVALAWDRDRRMLSSGWDLLSFCADILFRRADHLPSRRVEAREAIGVGQWDQAFGLLDEPWVDRWMFRLLGELPRLGDAVTALPGQARLWLTHDLDNLAKWRIRSVAGQILRTPWQLARGRFAPLARAWSEIAVKAITGRDPFDVMDRVLAMEAGRRSANFFLANGRDHLFHRYDLAREPFRRVMLGCLEKGMDVGLHGQVHFISDGAAIAAEKRKMERLSGTPIRLNRQHYLRWDPTATFAGLEAAGIVVDSTLGYNDSPGFRTGSAFPFLWFDCASGKPTRLLEVPLILGEFQFYDPRCFDGESVRARMKGYLEAATRQGGVFTALFHNDYFYEKQFPGHGAVYADLLSYAGVKGLPDFDPLGTHARYVGADARP